METKAKIEEILSQMYMTADDLMVIMPQLKYVTALKYITEAQEQMRKLNYYVPVSQRKMALTKILRKTFGF